MPRSSSVMAVKIIMHKFPSIDYVMSLTPGGMRDGRDNVIKLMTLLWNPQNRLRVFHVTGSNGKWSVCQMLSQVLWKNFWKKVWLFTSPHFIDITERFQINGKQISETELNSYYERVVYLSQKHNILLSFFEIQVVVMVLYFCDEKIDYAVIEVWLGGTYDGTNIFTNPRACFITSITLEHTHVLGKTRASVLKNKLGIAKPWARLYTHIRNKQIDTYCQANRVKLLKIEKTNSNTLTNLPWKHQQKNAELVLQSLKDEWFNEKKIKEGLSNIDNPGRFHWLSPTLLVDTANNAENIHILAQMVMKLKYKNVITLFGTTQTEKEYARKLADMIPAKERFIIDDFCDRSLSAWEYAIIGKRERILHFSEINKKWLKELQKQDNTVVVAYGSFYLIGEIMKLSIYKPFATG